MSVDATIAGRKAVHGDYATQSLVSMNLLRAMRQATGYYYLSSAQEEALLLIAVKIGRILTGNPNEKDHWHDIAGYARLVENILDGKPANGTISGGTAGSKAAEPIGAVAQGQYDTPKMAEPSATNSREFVGMQSRGGGWG